VAEILFEGEKSSFSKAVTVCLFKPDAEGNYLDAMSRSCDLALMRQDRSETLCGFYHAPPAGFLIVVLRGDARAVTLPWKNI